MKQEKRPIVYFGGYAGKEIESHSPAGGYNAATNKMNYIIELLKRSGESVHVLAYYHSTESGYIRKEKHMIDEREIHTYMSVLDVKRGVFRKLSGLYTKWTIFKNLLLLPRHTRLLVYNMPVHNGIVRMLTKFKRFDVTLDVEEVFFVLNPSEKAKKRELAAYRNANRYIVVFIRVIGCPSKI